ncbi:MAG: hypothetical protein FWF28_00800 [Micrococcales bacterium]|nr:hypothetical protein [Micrococcales bacterium]
MKRKTAAIYLAADIAMIVALGAASAPAWALVVLVVLALPLAVLAALPRTRHDA